MMHPFDGKDWEYNSETDELRIGDMTATATQWIASILRLSRGPDWCVTWFVKPKDLDMPSERVATTEGPVLRNITINSTRRL